MAQLLQLNISILKLANPLDSDRLFVRYYVAVDNGKRIRVDTRELPPSPREPRWDEHASLERHGGAEDIKEVRVVFELRSRRNASVCGVRIAGPTSRLLARGEVAWSDAVESGDVSLERWVRLDDTRTAGSKPVALLVRMGVRVRDSGTAARGKLYECSCESCGWVGSEEDMFLNANAVSMINY